MSDQILAGVLTRAVVSPAVVCLFLFCFLKTGWTLWGNPRHANWNAVDTGPHRDLLQEVGDAVRCLCCPRSKRGASVGCSGPNIPESPRIAASIGYHVMDCTGAWC